MIYTGDSMQNMCLTVDCNDITDKELQELQEVLKNYCYFLWPPYMAYRILVPQPGIEPMPPAVEVWS